MVLLFTSLYLTKEANYSLAQAGFVMSFYGVGSILGSFSGGWLTDRFNHHRIMFWSLVSSGLILLLLTATTNQTLLCIIMFCYAFTADMFRPANSAAISTYSTPETRTRSISLVRLAVNLGFSVGPAIGGFIAYNLGYFSLFVIDAVTSCGAALLLHFYLPKNYDSHDSATEAKPKPVLSKANSAYNDHIYLFFVFLVALYGTSFFQLFASIPQYFAQDCLYSEETIGLLLALNGFLVVIIEMPLMQYLQHHTNTFRFIVWGVIFIPLSFLCLLFGQHLVTMAVIYTLLITFSEIFAMPFMMNFSLSRPIKARQGQYSALYSIGYGVSNIIAPSLGLGLATAYGFNAMFGFFIGLCAFVALGFWWLGKKVEAEKINA